MHEYMCPTAVCVSRVHSLVIVGYSPFGLSSPASSLREMSSSLSNQHLCWPVPLLLLVVVTSAWVISSFYTSSSSSSSKEEDPGQQVQQEGQGSNDTADLSAIMQLLSQINRTSSARRVCPPPYERVMDQCYYANRHHKLPWEGARRFCHGMGGELAQPRRFNALLAFLLETHGMSVKRWYLGGTDADEEGVWRWLRGAPVGEGDWSQGEPNGETRENCLEVFTYHEGEDSPSFPALNDESCDSRLNFVCEYLMTDD